MLANARSKLLPACLLAERQSVQRRDSAVVRIEEKREGKGREEKRRDETRRDGKGRDGKGREGKGREGKRREEKS
jgi:hypothetical protein